MQDLGFKSVAELHKNLYNGGMTMAVRSSAARKEGNVHDLKCIVNHRITGRN
jgi:hypothetical protein